jgi:hypothetical protein
LGEELGFLLFERFLLFGLLGGLDGVKVLFFGHCCGFGGDSVCGIGGGAVVRRRSAGTVVMSKLGSAKTPGK